MSYILDALKKSETERYEESQSQKEGFAQPLWLSRQKKRSIWPVVLTVALILNAALLAWLLWPSSQGEESPDGDMNRSVLPTDEPLSPRVTDTPQTDLPVTAKSAVVDGATERRILVENTTLVDSAGPADKPKTVSAPKASTLPNDLEKISPQALEQAAVPQAPSTQAEVSSASPRAYSAMPNNEAVDARSDTISDIPTIEELPLATQKRIPALTFSSHIYSTDPDSRRIMINDRYLREGQKVQGLRVVEVTSEGVILSLRGEVFEIPVLRDWSPDAR